MTTFPQQLAILQPFWGTWTLIDAIGEGSYGKVYRIERSDYDRCYEAALKWISLPLHAGDVKRQRLDGMSDEEISTYYTDIVQGMREEIDLMMRLRHSPNIVAYEDHLLLERRDTIGWDILIRMELLTPLPYVYANGMMVGDVIQLGIDICDGLEECRKQRIIHRDIKPDNLFLSPRGDYCLGDFGVARQMEATMASMSRQGTPLYMAPEIYANKKHYDLTVDLYSLGLVMHRLLNHQRVPFLSAEPGIPTQAQRNIAFERRMRGEPLPQPAEGGRALAEIILRACAYDPAQRFQTPLDMRDALVMVSQTPNNWGRLSASGSLNTKGSRLSSESRSQPAPILSASSAQSSMCKRPRAMSDNVKDTPISSERLVSPSANGNVSVNRNTGRSGMSRPSIPDYRFKKVMEGGDGFVAEAYTPANAHRYAVDEDYLISRHALEPDARMKKPHKQKSAILIVILSMTLILGIWTAINWQIISDQLFFTEARNMFTLGSYGYYPMGPGTLGGEATLSEYPVMIVKTDRRTLMRAVTKDEYTGRSWRDTISSERYLYASPRWAEQRDQALLESIPSEAVRGASDILDERVVTVQMQNTSSSTLLAPAFARSIKTQNGMVCYFNNASELFITRDLQIGDQYSITAPILEGGGIELGALINATPKGNDPYYAHIVHDYTLFPEHMQQEVSNYAQQLTESVAMPYDKACAIMLHLKRYYSYTLTPATPPENQDFATYFLYSGKEGYCTYFASAMTVLCRMAGLPARYVEGFIAQPGGDGNAYITGKDAHAWTEVYFEGFGWVPFDATPMPEEQAMQSDNQNPVSVSIRSMQDSEGDETAAAVKTTVAVSPVPTANPTATSTPTLERYEARSVNQNGNEIMQIISVYSDGTEFVEFSNATVFQYALDRLVVEMQWGLDERSNTILLKYGYLDNERLLAEQYRFQRISNGAWTLQSAEMWYSQGRTYTATLIEPESDGSLMYYLLDDLEKIDEELTNDRGLLIGKAYASIPLDFENFDIAAFPRVLETIPQSLGCDIDVYDTYAVVYNPDPTDRLRLRTKPNTNSGTLMRLYTGAMLYVIKNVNAKWAQVRLLDVGGLEGYVMREFLINTNQTTIMGAMGSRSPAGRVDLSNSHLEFLTLYDRPSGSNGRSSIARLNDATDVRVLGVSDKDVLVVITSTGQSGYLDNQYVSLEGYSGSDEVRQNKTKLYSRPKTNVKAVDTFDKGTPVVCLFNFECRDTADGWRRVRIGDTVGYMQEKHLK